MFFSMTYRSIYISFIIIPYLFFIYSYFLQLSSPSSSSSINHAIQIQKSSPSLKLTDTGRVLVIYVWVDKYLESLGNLQFFIRHGVHSSQPADYFFIIQKFNGKPVNESTLPLLPPNAHYIQHENECYDLGTVGWFLSQNITKAALYKYFIFMNSSVRGPFFPPYFPDDRMWWFTIFTRRLTDEVKLVGSTISCQINPHVQSYVLVTDRVGFRLLTSVKAGVFRCHAGYNEAVMNGEIAASRTILNANYQIASLQSKYQNWDFRKKNNRRCNGGIAPIFDDKAIDGIIHDPFELIFVKYKVVPSFDTNLQRRAFVYESWLNGRPQTKKNNSNRK